MSTDPLSAFDYAIDPNLTSVKLTMPQTTLQVTDLDNLILALGRIRATLKPEHPSSPPPLDKWTYRPLDAWHLFPRNGSTVPADDGFLLVVKSPAYGWCQFGVDPEEAAAMLRFLQGVAPQRPPDDQLN